MQTPILTTRPRRHTLPIPALKGARREAVFGYLFISPWIVGFLALQLGPMLASLGISLTDWTLLDPPHYIGLDNYRRIADDPLFVKSLRVTATYTFISVPCGVVLALLIASLLNRTVRGISFFRGLFYLPVVVTGVGTAVVWDWVFNPEYGILNSLLSLIGVEGPGWLSSTTWALPAMIIISFWGIGGAVVVFLAALQGVPRSLYEAAMIDGAGRLSLFWNVTVPMVSPAILFNTIIAVIASFQAFTYAYVLTEGRGSPAYSTLFYVLYLYQNAFRWFDMGYASALAWILFLIIISCTLLLLRLSRPYVHYEGATR
ncbi:MAG: multiple sugar transport system permease protein [Thermomicrobiales bacterium]|nr:multiple sugar transport system permease protein [Thermomicrobiales bacterium]